MTILEQKYDQLIKQSVSTLRFMNYDELLRILYHNQAHNEAMQWEKSFEDVLKDVSRYNPDWAKAWSKAAHQWIHWDYSYATPVNYQTLQSAYTKLLLTCKNKQQALSDLRGIVLKLLAGESKRAPEQVLRQRVTNTGGYNKFYQKRKDLLLELCEDPDFFIKRERTIRDVLIKLTPGVPDNEQERNGLGFHEQQAPYHVVCFFLPQVFKQMGGNWGYLHADASALIGIVSMMPSRTFSNQIKDDMVKAANANPNALTPLFNWRGMRVY